MKITTKQLKQIIKEEVEKKSETRYDQTLQNQYVVEGVQGVLATRQQLVVALMRYFGGTIGEAELMLRIIEGHQKAGVYAGR